jgi:RND family efflux transporter MFP subunit
VDSAQAALTSAQQKAESALHAAQSQVDTAQGNLTAVQLKADQAMRAANTGLVSAQNALTTAQQKADQALLAAENQVTSAQNALTAAQHNYDLKVQASSVTLEADLQTIASAELALKNAQLNATKSNQSAANQVEQSKQSVVAAQHGYDAKLAPAGDAQIATDQAAVATAQNGLDSARKALSLAHLTAPVDGVVVAVTIRPGSIAPSGYAVTLQGTDLQVVADFTESDLPSLALQQPTSVAVTAVGATVNGTVTAIAPQAASTSGGVVTYAVTIGLVDPPGTVRVGMSAQASVVTAQAADVLTVPSAALRGASGNYTVQVLDASGTPQTVPVTVVLVSSGLAEIQSGLSAGERVVTGTVSARQGTTTTQGGGIAIPGGFGGGGITNQGGGRNGGGRGGTGGTGGTGGGTTP